MLAQGRPGRLHARIAREASVCCGYTCSLAAILANSAGATASMHVHGWCLHTLNCASCAKPGELGGRLAINDWRERLHTLGLVCLIACSKC